MSAWEAQTGMNGKVRSWKAPKDRGRAKVAKRRVEDQLDEKMMSDDQLRESYHSMLAGKSPTSRRSR